MNGTLNSYTLTATLNRNTNRKTIWARDEEVATFEAIAHILDQAYKNKEGAWAKGYIKLVDSEGNLIREMEAK